jgi:TPR repeat protein
VIARLLVASLLLPVLLTPGAALAAKPKPPTEVVLTDVEAPPACEWRRSVKRPDATPSLYCPDGDKGLRYARKPQGFGVTTLPDARAGDPKAMNILGVYFFTTEPPVQNAATGQDWLVKAAAAGSVDATFNLGVALTDGKALTKDPAAAAGWFRKAADLGDGQAMINLAGQLLSGETGAADDAEALRLVKAATALNLPEADYDLAMMTSLGRGVPRDQPAALDLFRKAAEGKSAAAAWRLALAYQAGDGVEADPEAALTWMRKAEGRGIALAIVILDLNRLMLGARAPAVIGEDARKGDGKAQMTLGLMLLDGKGVAKDPALAAKLFRAAADQGYPLAATLLARQYADGVGVERDPLQALAWYRKGLARGYAEPWAAFTGMRTAKD